MPVTITTEGGATVETVFWVDFRREGRCGVGLRRGDDAWPAEVALSELRAEWHTEHGQRLTREQLEDCLQSLAADVYE